MHLLKIKRRTLAVNSFIRLLLQSHLHLMCISYDLTKYLIAPFRHFAPNSLRLADIVERASRSMSSEKGRSLNYEYMTMRQTGERARAAAKTVQGVRLNALNLRRRALRICRQLDAFKKIMMFLGENDIAGVRRVLGQALKDGKSPFAILATLQSAFEGRYRARGHTEDDFDLAILVLRVGGPSLLYALSKSLGLPSLASVYVELTKRKVSASGGCRIPLRTFCVFFALIVTRLTMTTVKYQDQHVDGTSFFLLDTLQPKGILHRG